MSKTREALEAAAKALGKWESSGKLLPEGRLWETLLGITHDALALVTEALEGGGVCDGTDGCHHGCMASACTCPCHAAETTPTPPPAEPTPSGDEFEMHRSADWRDRLDENGVPTCGPAVSEHAGCHYCSGPLNARKPTGQYECPWCIARFPDHPHTEPPPAEPMVPRRLAMEAVQAVIVGLVGARANHEEAMTSWWQFAARILDGEEARDGE